MPIPKSSAGSDSLDARVDAALKSAGDADVREFLIESIALDERLAARFVSRFGQHDPREEAKLLRSELAAIRKQYARGGFIEYRDAWDFERDYQDAIDLHLQPFARSGDGSALFSLLEVAVTHFCGISIDDSEGFSSSTFSLLHDYWVTAFGLVPAEEVPKRVKGIERLVEKLESSARAEALNWYVAPELLDIPMELFSSDPEYAGCVIELCDRRIDTLGKRAEEERARREWEYAVRSKYARGVGWATPAEFEQRRWALRRMEAMESLERSLDEIGLFARPFFGSDTVLLAFADVCERYGECGRAVEALSHTLEEGRLQGFCADGVRLRLLDAYASAEMREEEVELLAEMLQAPELPHGASAAQLLQRYRQRATYDDWEAERERLFAGMSSKLTLCDCLLEEGLDQRIYDIAKQSERFPVSRYQDALLRVDSEFVLQWYAVDALAGFDRAYDRRGYRGAARRLVELAELPGGCDAARKAADELRQRFPRKTALHDELAKAGF